MTGQGAPRLRVAVVLGSASGGTASHVVALAEGCRAAGVAITVFGPPETLARLPRGTDALTVPIGDRPRPGRDGAAIVRLRAGLAARRPDVVHAHGVRAGAFAAVAIATLRVGTLRVGALRVGALPAGTLPAGTLPAGTLPAGTLPAGTLPAGTLPAGTLPAGTLPAGTLPAGTLPAGTLPGAALPGAAGRAHGRPALAVTVHNAPPSGGTARIVYGLLERICARRADIVLCASADLLTRMRARGARAQQFDVPAPPRSAPTAADVAAAKTDIGAGGGPVVLAVGRLAPQKGLDVLIEAAVRWRDRDPQPRTVIAGAGPLEADLRAQARETGADVVFLGARDDVPALLAAADVVVVPSRWEARALVIQEAMRSGRPVVATRVGGIPELTGSDGAVLVPPEDSAALAKAVSAVLGDTSFAARLGTAAKQRSATFPSEQDAVRDVLAIYGRLAAREPAGPDCASKS